MTVTLPASAPTSLGEAFAHINSVTSPTLDDLKVMVLLEAAGLELYRGVAADTDNVAVKALLEHNGREELAHAHRVSKAILAISGEEFLPPDPGDNPYLATALPCMSASAEALRGLAKGEFGGEALYASWAANTENQEVSRLFLLNGKEEAEHDNRLLEAADLLSA